METQGIITLIIWLLTTTTIVVANKPIRRFLGKEWFWKIIPPIFSIYVLVAKIIPEWTDGKLLSGDFLLDFCAFAGLVVPILSAFKKTRIIAKWFAIWLLIGSGTTAFQLFTSHTSGNYWKWFFYQEKFGSYGEGVEDDITPLHNFMHYFTFNLGVILLLNISQDELNFKYTLGNVLSMSLYLIYVFIVKEIAGFTENITGLGSYDWVEGEYRMAGRLFNMSYPDIFIFGFTTLAILDFSIVSVQFLNKRLIKKYKWNNWFV